MERQPNPKKKDRRQVDEKDWKAKLDRQQLLKQAGDARERASEQMRRRKQTIFVKNWR
jgi:hypothetical protein